MGRRLASAINPNGDNIAYTYNADGLFTSKKKGSIEYYYYWNGDKLTAQTDNGNTWYFRYDGDTPIGLEFDGVEYYYVTNLQGDIIAILDSNGTCVVEYEYDAWGNCTVTKDTNTIAYINPLRYRGYYYDSDTDLYYLQSRYYDANTGRFINADEPSLLVFNSTNSNLYSYCDNDCINSVDKSGYASRKVTSKNAYNRSAVKRYIKKWVKGHNPSYPNLDKKGGDCTNFVSQCMHAGGFKMNNDWYCGKRSGINKDYYTKPWVQAYSLYSYVLECMSKYKTYTIKSAKDVKNIYKKLDVGDLLFFNTDKREKNISHSAIIYEISKTAKDGLKVKYGQHTWGDIRDLVERTTNWKKYNWKKGWVVYVIHIDKYATWK